MYANYFARSLIRQRMTILMQCILSVLQPIHGKHYCQDHVSRTRRGYLALPRVYGRDSIDSACVFYFLHKITHWSRHIRFYTRYLSVMARRIYPIDDLFYSYIARDTRADGMRTHRVMN